MHAIAPFNAQTCLIMRSFCRAAQAAAIFSAVLLFSSCSIRGLAPYYITALLPPASSSTERGRACQGVAVAALRIPPAVENL